MLAALSWKPSRYAVSVIRRPDPGGSGYSTLSVRHPNAPCEVALDGYSTSSETIALSEYDIRDLLVPYLDSLASQLPKVGLKLAQHSAKQAQDVQTLACLPVDDDKPRWRKSFWFRRGAGGQQERTLVLQAQGNTSCHESEDKQGIRVVGHVDRSGRTLLITSMSAYLEDDKAVRIEPDSRSRSAERGSGSDDPRAHKAPTTAGGDFVNHIDVAPWLDPASKGSPDEIRSRRPTGNAAKLLKLFRENDKRDREIVEDCDARFVQHERSDLLRTDVDVAGYNRAAAHSVWDVAPRGGFEPPENAKALRSDHFSMEKAYFNSNLLLERFEQFGVEPESYFRSALPTMAVHFRAGMPYGPGKDGQTVNAAVQPHEPPEDGSDEATPWRRHQIAPDLCQDPPELHVLFALANRSHRGRIKVDGRNRTPAEPLGIAADPRWVWHEMGHVLLMATTGELEMRFAHSPGDALAAIAADPDSHFADGTNGDEDRNRRWRGATFPWVHIPRRHDRCVRRGWSWSGAMHRPVRQLEDVRQPRRKGYRSEQILSTSLYRLYLCLGGYARGPKDGRLRRHMASSHAIYLIIKGLALLGDARIVAANHPDQLVSALIDADIGTEAFGRAAFGEPLALPGGVAHKAIRWAFEAQGLYAGGALDNNDRGEPPPVDIFIGDARASHEEWCDGRVDYGPGSYVPVAFDMPDYPNPSKGQGNSASGLPDWFSSDIKVDRDKRQVQVTVKNRGTEVAGQVRVRVYFAAWSGGELPPWAAPDKEGSLWQEMEHDDGLKRKHDDKRSSFGPFIWEPQIEETYLILAEASCDADRANTDPASGLPCSRSPVPLADLVINDNNLGLTLSRP